MWSMAMSTNQLLKKIQPLINKEKLSSDINC